MHTTTFSICLEKQLGLALDEVDQENWFSASQITNIISYFLVVIKFAYASKLIDPVEKAVDIKFGKNVLTFNIHTTKKERSFTFIEELTKRLGHFYRNVIIPFDRDSEPPARSNFGDIRQLQKVMNALDLLTPYLGPSDSTKLFNERNCPRSAFNHIIRANSKEVVLQVFAELLNIDVNNSQITVKVLTQYLGEACHYKYQKQLCLSLDIKLYLKLIQSLADLQDRTASEALVFVKIEFFAFVDWTNKLINPVLCEIEHIRPDELKKIGMQQNLTIDD